MSSFRSRVRPVATALAGLTCASVLMVQPASAALLDHGTFSDHYGPDVSFCGEPFLQEGTSTGRYRVVGRGPNGLAYELSNSKSTDTWTNQLSTEDNPPTVTTKTVGSGGDVRITINGDGTVTHLIKFKGSTQVYGPDGQLIDHSAGQFAVERVMDDSGTPTDLSDDVFLRRNFVKETGNLPADLCALLTQYIG